jgi:hypothetical protein
MYGYMNVESQGSDGGRGMMVVGELWWEENGGGRGMMVVGELWWEENGGGRGIWW